MPQVVISPRGAVVLVGTLLATVGCGRQSASAAVPPPQSSSGQQQWDSRQPRQRDRDSRQQAPAVAEPSPVPAPEQRVIARVNGREITMGQLQQPLIEGYGLTILLNLVQLELARQAAHEARVTVAPEDVAAERELTLTKLFPEAEKTEHEALFEQFLQQQRITRAEFDILLQTNAHLRKVIAPQVRGKVTEENLKTAYNQTYGETVQVRHIQLANMAEIAEARRRLSEGEPFERVAELMSRNPRTAPLGGELPLFSRAATNYPQAFRDTAFALKQGEVSDPVQADGFFHLIKLEQRFEPKVVEFEDVKESLRQDLEDRLIQTGMNQLRNELAQEALRSLKIEEPVLREQFQRRREESSAQVTDESQVRQELQRRLQRIQERQRELEADAATTTPAPATTPTTGPADEPRQP